MNEYSEIENKLKQSNLEVDKILNELVNIRFICLYNGKVLVREKSLPSINLQKSLIVSEVIKESANTSLNLILDNLSSIPFEYYNNYYKRYYVININKNNLLELSNLYHFADIESIDDIDDKHVLSMYKKNNLP